ncbi:MAG TPA: hypothetical protein VJP02_12250 [Candidatus Sulfotelmatobacter sp.]|nr:hypothetical protein [Candidatus Sulfotelmatobacter sp.]
MKRGALFISMSAIIFVACVSVCLRIEQYRFRRQAERLLEDVRGLELRKASAAEVRSVVKKWGFQEWGRGPGPGEPCTDEECIYRFELVPKTDRDIFSNPFAFRGVTFLWSGLGCVRLLSTHGHR